jgi:hypothetical protein
MKYLPLPEFGERVGGEVVIKHLYYVLSWVTFLGFAETAIPTIGA